MDTLINQKNVLLIEDDFPISDLYYRILSQAGMKVRVCYDGLAGLVAAQEKPDLVLLDIMLPKMNGLEVLAKLKSLEATKFIPVVLLTNFGQEEIIKKAYQLGAQGYFLKMRVDPAKLAEILNQFLINPDFKMTFDSLTLD